MNLDTIPIKDLIASLARRSNALVVCINGKETFHPNISMCGNPIAVTGMLRAAIAEAIEPTHSYLVDLNLITTGTAVLNEKPNDTEPTTQTDEPVQEPRVGDADPDDTESDNLST